MLSPPQRSALRCPQPIAARAAAAVGQELPFLSKAIPWQSCSGHLTDVSGEPRGDEGGDIIAAAEEKCR